MLAEYTIQVRTILASLNLDKKESGLNNSEALIRSTWDKVFNAFPIWSEEYREELCVKILRHYFIQEICCETVALWKFYLNQKMNEIMPYYNELYKTIWEDFTELYNDTNLTRTNTSDMSSNTTDQTDSTGTFKGAVSVNGKVDTSESGKLDKTESKEETTTIGSETTANSSNTFKGKSSEIGNKTTTANGINKYSDTPQGTIANLESSAYLTNVTMDDKNSTDTTNSTSSTDTSNTDTNTSKTDSNGSVKDSVTIGQTDSKTGKQETSNTTVTDNATTDKTTKGVDYNDLKHFEEVVKGKAGGASYVELLEKIRNSIINIDMLIINELRDCFMMIY